MTTAVSSSELCSRGVRRRDQGDVYGALADFEEALRGDPCLVEAWNNSGAIRFALGDAAGALADFDHAIAGRPGYPEPHNNRGLVRSQLGDLRGALADFDRAIGLHPRYADALVNRGTARLALGDVVGALEDFDRAVGIRPDCVEAYRGRASALRAWGGAAAALADGDRLLGLVPEREAVLVHHLRAGALCDLNRFAEAADACTRAIELDPAFCTAYISRGNARYHQRDPAGFADYFHAYQLDPSATVAEVTRILRQDAERDPKGVLENCRKHLRISRDDVLPYARRGLTLVLLGREAEAAPDLAEFLRRLPEWRGFIGDLIDASKAHAGPRGSAGCGRPVVAGGFPHR